MAQSPSLLLVAHGTREAAGPAVIERIAAAVQRRIGVDVRVAYVDVIGPTVAEALAAIRGPAVVVPAFLAAGYHVRHDLPAQIRNSRRGDEVVVTAALGPSPGLALAMGRRLHAAGWRRGDRVVFAAAGSSDPHALTEVATAADLLGRMLSPTGPALTPTYITTASPSTSELLAQPGPTDRPTLIVPYLLAPGRFHQWLQELGTDAVAEPIGAHPHVVELIVQRYRSAIRGYTCAV
ncbi:sirohydrochlorin chelatase [Haloactinomyces albus]|uniref:Sirohydrochlorin ferrochelatase n=1 Tax=Haloactinomyces albus TaxID=1352928 RepID=A0AAE3ZIV7_9ACTN|nr:sirohydrochlorin chelatase [Haloactinomyces albus]MDR7304418.1 sirohydrochlorin ferrochelatase [Haloactinomyces albus]